MPPQYRFVRTLPDLINPEDYEGDPDGRLVRVRISSSADGIDVLGDAVSPQDLERILEMLEPEVIEQMLCG